MSSNNFVIRDSVEYVYRRRRYGFRATWRSIRRKLAALKLYFFLTLLCGAAGAGAVLLSDYKPQIPAITDDLMDLEKLKNMSSDQKRQLMEKHGGGDMGDMSEMMEKYKDMMK